ncbi:hypothetical protein ACH5RR_010109 [Cinchona calisaya]|uniref:Uncharacterized protein n=1 Tax=Cinchona calisaya TaxID=153742 RepID=A0ABD3AGA6_9GENT
MVTFGSVVLRKAGDSERRRPISGMGLTWLASQHYSAAQQADWIQEIQGFRYPHPRSPPWVKGTEDSFFEMVNIRPGGVYTKAQLQKELQTLAGCGMFEKVYLDGKTNPDGTIGITVSFLVSTWQCADRFRCINAGLMPQSKPIEMDPDMTEKERIEYYRSREEDYRRRLNKRGHVYCQCRCREKFYRCLREKGTVSARLLQKIRDSVQQWSHENGYACAQVVNFGNLPTKEVVCEVVEGDITQLVIQFQDKLGNVCEGTLGWLL